jgi:glutathione S-transferase
MKIYDWGMAPNPRRLHIFLAEKGLDIERIEVGTDGAKLADWYKEKYPHALTPMLELDDGTCIGEVPAIWDYLEAIYPEPALIGRTPAERARAIMWEALARDDGFYRAGEVFRNTHPAFVDRGLPGSREPIPQIPELAERGRAAMARFFAKFDAQLADKEFVAGAYFSIADITTLCTIDFAKWTRIQIPQEYTNLTRWHAAVSNRPSAKEGTRGA